VCRIFWFGYFVRATVGKKVKVDTEEYGIDSFYASLHRTEIRLSRQMF